MKEIIVNSQAELDTLSVDYDGRIIIKFGTPLNRAVINRKFKYPVVARGNSSVVARGNSSVVARGNSSVVAWENSSVEARDNSSVEAWENSSVEAWENSSVVARDNSSVEAWENSSVEAWENSSVEAWENSSVVARDNSSVVARGNSQIAKKSEYCKTSASGNARIVYDPTNIEEYIDFYGLESTKTTVRLFKAVRKLGDGTYHADWDYNFIYEVGKVAIADSLDTDITEDCGHGIHMAYKTWALDYGRGWSNFALLELEVEKQDVIVPRFGSGKVRAAEAKVIREVPLEECGLYGKMIAKQRARND